MFREAFEGLFLRHRSTPGHAGQDHALRKLRHGQLDLQLGRRRKRARNPRNDFIRDAEPVELAELFGDRAVDRRVPGMQPHDPLPGPAGRRHDLDDLRQRELRTVDQLGLRGAFKQFLIDQ